jgi:hypothetical protein
MVKTPFILRPLAVLLFSVVLACGSDDDSSSTCDDGSDPVCNVCNPTENLPWLRDKIAELKNSEQGNQVVLYSGMYENRPVFVQGSCCAACLWIPVVWTCDGEHLDAVTSMSNIADLEWIWGGKECQRYD